MVSLLLVSISVAWKIYLNNKNYCSKLTMVVIVVVNFFTMPISVA